MNRELLDEMNRIAPGSVQIDEEIGSITLIGWRLEQFKNSDSNENGSKYIKENTDRARIPEITGKLGIRLIKIVEKQPLLVGMINPLTDAPKKQASRNTCCCSRGVCRQQSCAIQNENKPTDTNNRFIPVIKHKFCHWVLHSRSLFRKSRLIKRILSQGKSTW